MGFAHPGVQIGSFAFENFWEFFRRSLWPTKVWVRLGWRKFRFFVPTWNSQDFIIIILRAVLTSGEKSSTKHFTKSRSKLNLTLQDNLYTCKSIIFCIFSLCFNAHLLTVSPMLDMTFLQNTTLTNYKEAQIKQQKFVAELQVFIQYHRFDKLMLCWKEFANSIKLQMRQSFLMCTCSKGYNGLLQSWPAIFFTLFAGPLSEVILLNPKFD